MFRNFFITSIRSLLKNRVYSFINIVGISLCFVAVFFILQYVHFEKSFDSYHTKQDRIFRVGMSLEYENSSSVSVGSYYGMGEQSKIDFSQLEDFFTMTFDNSNQGFLGHDQDGVMESYRVNGSHAASPSILEILDFEFVEGTSASGLSGISNVVITKSLAQRIFGKESALGKSLVWYNTSEGSVHGKALQVGAVIKDLPDNTHFNFELLVPLKSFEADYPAYRENIWRWYGYYNYVLLKNHEDQKVLEASYPGFIDRHLGDRTLRTYQPTIFLEPLSDIHLKSMGQYQIQEGGDSKTINILILIAIFLPILAYTNYINLVTSLNLQRAKEIGIRKIIGSSKKQLITQFLMETFMINGLALLMALIVVFGLKQTIPNWIDGYPEAYLLKEIDFWMLSGILIVALSLISGIYPALVVGKFKNIEVLKGNFSQSTKGKFLHRIMVVLQFTLASVLISFTLIVNQQLQFMFNEELGADIDQVLVARAPFIQEGSYRNAIRTFQNSAAGSSEILAIAASTAIPGIERWGNSARVQGKSDEGQVLRRMDIDEFYLDVYQHEVVAGRGFSREFKSDQHAVVVNEKAAEILGFSIEEIINKNIYLSGDTVNVVGVIKNYHHNSLKSEILPMIMTKADEDIFYISIRLQTSDLSRVMENIEDLWEESFPGNTLDTFFANDHFQNLYAKEQRLGKIVVIFTSTAVLIACLGIFGLSLFTLIRKRKEIGIRKILGAPKKHLSWIFAKEIVYLILIAGFVGIPISYLMVDNWLESFANRIGIDLISVVLPIMIILVLTVGTIAHNIFKTLKVNPVETLRHQ